MTSNGLIIGPMEGVFLTPMTEPFFPSDTDIQPKINVARHRHRHSDLVARHLTLHFSPTLTVSFPSRHRTSRKISSRRSTLRLPSWALIMTALGQTWVKTTLGRLWLLMRLRVPWRSWSFSLVPWSNVYPWTQYPNIPFMVYMES